MSHKSKDDGASLVTGGVLGLIAAGVLAIPFYGFAPLLLMMGALLVLAVIIKLASGST